MKDPTLSQEPCASNVPPALSISPADRAQLKALDAKIKALLPNEYHACYDYVAPESMGSAGLKFGPDGMVAWHQIWTSFCHLALAGGPPHRGKLLETVAAEEVLAAPEAHNAVLQEIGRGIWLVSELPVQLQVAPGWIGVNCQNEMMADWLVRAIVAENVSARHEGQILYLPAGPRFPLEKEIKNVITALAKTSHYWSGHMTDDQLAAIASMTAAGNPPSTKVLEPAAAAEVRAAPDQYQAAVEAIGRGIHEGTGRTVRPGDYLGWVGVECNDEEMAVWLLRAVIVENILVRREKNVLYLPASPGFSLGEQTRDLCARVVQAFSLWTMHVAVKQQVVVTCRERR